METLSGGVRRHRGGGAKRFIRIVEFNPAAGLTATVEHIEYDPGRSARIARLKDDKGNPDICMVYYYHNLFSGKETCQKVCEECKAGARGCVACKKELAKNITDFLKMHVPAVARHNFPNRQSLYLLPLFAYMYLLYQKANQRKGLLF